MAKFVKRAVDAAKGKQAATAPDDKAFAKDHPALWEYMSLRRHEDGKSRETLTITLFIDQDEWKAAMNDRDNHRTAFVSSDTFQTLLDAMEGALAGDSADWRAYDQGKGKFRK